MGERMKSILGAAAVGGIVAYIGIEYLFYPAMAANPPDQVDAILSSPWDIVLYVLILVVFLDVFYVLNGNRAAYPAVLSAFVLLVSWYSIAKVYDALA